MLPKNLLLRHLTTTSHTSPEISTDCPRVPHPITDFPLNLVAVIVFLAFLLFLALAAILYSKCRRRHRLALQLPLKPPGLPKKAIKSLPSFRFASLRASIDGLSLDCAVCLSQFQDPDVLRFLPICRHAFHVDCVDRWLATCSTCPICRSSVSAVNPARFSVPDSIVLSSDSTTDELGIEVLVERDEDRRSGAGFGGGKLNPHKIVVSDVVFRNRWSDVSCSDLMFLNSDSPAVEGRRSLSEITVAPRENPVDVAGAGVEERMRKIWFPIAKRTVESFGSRGGTDKSGRDFA